MGLQFSSQMKSGTFTTICSSPPAGPNTRAWMSGILGRILKSKILKTQPPRACKVGGGIRSWRRGQDNTCATSSSGQATFAQTLRAGTPNSRGSRTSWKLATGLCPRFPHPRPGFTPMRGHHTSWHMLREPAHRSLITDVEVGAGRYWSAPLQLGCGGNDGCSWEASEGPKGLLR